MSRICRNIGDSGKLRFYKLDDESKMRLLKTHSHTSNGLAMEPGTRDKTVERNADPKTRQKSRVKNLPRTVGVAGGAEKALEPAAYRRYGGGGQERLYGKPTTGKVLWRFCPADDAICKITDGDTECPLRVCQLSRSSESTHFLCLRRDVVLFDSTRAPDSFGDRRHVPPIYFLTFPNIKREPYHTKSTQMISNSDNYRPFEAVS